MWQYWKHLQVPTSCSSSSSCSSLRTVGHSTGNTFCVIRAPQLNAAFSSPRFDSGKVVLPCDLVWFWLEEAFHMLPRMWRGRSVFKLSEVWKIEYICSNRHMWSLDTHHGGCRWRLLLTYIYQPQFQNTSIMFSWSISYHSNQSGMSGHGICPAAPDVRMLGGGPGFKTS